MEKSKSSLDVANNELAGELKQLTVGKQEAERRRKQAEAQLQEANMRVAELDRNNTDLTAKVAKLQVSYVLSIFQRLYSSDVHGLLNGWL